MQNIVPDFDWRRDWMLWLIGAMFVLILFFEWRNRYLSNALRENFKVSNFTIENKVPVEVHQPMFLPWRDWKRPTTIPTLVPSISNPGGVQLQGDSQLRGGRWGYAPPMNAVEASTPVEMTSDQPSSAYISGNSSPMPVGMVSQVGTDVSNCSQDLFEESAVPRNVFSWQSGRTRVSLPLRTLADE